MVRRTIGLALGLAGRVSRLDAPIMPTASFAEICWDFENGVVGDHSGDLYHHLGCPRCNVLRAV